MSMVSFSSRHRNRNLLTFESDWLARSRAAGVVWAHNFSSDAEVTKFADYDPAYDAEWMKRRTDDGFGSGGCLEFYTPAGAHNPHRWPRPFSAFPGDIGYQSGDPDYPADPRNNWYKWRKGFRAHSDYRVDSNFTGGAFYIQYRVKFSSNYFNGNPSGKLVYIDICGGGNQEIIIQAPAGFDESDRYWMYTNFGSALNASLDGAQGTAAPGVASSQPGGAYNSTCNYPGFTGCWRFPVNEWVTVVIKVTPGHHNGLNPDPATATYKDTGIEVWIAHEGDTAYTKIWEKLDYVWSFDATSPAYGNQFGFNVFTPSAYKNGALAVTDWWYRITEVIFSTSMPAIPATASVGKQVSTAPSWFTSAADLTVLPIAGGPGYGSAYQNGARIDAVVPDATAYPNAQGAEGPTAITRDWTGATAYQRGAQYILPAQGGHNGYYSNAVLALALRSAVPAWQRVWGPTPDAQILHTEYSTLAGVQYGSYNPNYTGYADGSPRSAHGWFSNLCTWGGRVFVTFADANPSGTWDTCTFSIDMNNTSAGWTFHGRLWATVPGSPGSAFTYQSGPGAYDPVTNKFYRSPEGAVGTGSPTGGSGGVVGVDVATLLAAGPQSQSTGPQVPGSTIYDPYMPGGWQDGWSCIPPNMSPRCWIVGSRQDSNLKILNLENIAAGWTNVSTTGSPTGFVQGCGAVFHKKSKAILVGGVELGNVIRKLAITGSNPLTASYAWSTITVSGPTMADNPSSPNQGTFNKFQLIEDMGNGQSAIVMATRIDGPTFVIKLPAAGV